MKEHFSEKLESLRRQLIGMGAEVENQIRLAVEALVESDAAKARKVIEHDKVIDQMEIKNDEDAIELLATQQPVAGDLRLLVSSLKINADLERIGDHAVNIAEAAERMSRIRPFKPWIDIPYMAEIARGMLQEALDAFIRKDSELALAVCKRDDILDDKNKSIIRELLTYMAENPALISASIEIMSISKNLERVGDLATNIGEEAIYIAEGEVIKHNVQPNRGAEHATAPHPDRT
jgi:phosphate transport system protein